MLLWFIPEFIFVRCTAFLILAGISAFLILWPPCKVLAIVLELSLFRVVLSLCGILGCVLEMYWILLAQKKLIRCGWRLNLFS